MIKVLIADDNNIIRTSLVTTVDWKGLGCEVVAEAANGMQALELTEKYSPDLVITDIKMPKLDGLELTERLKSAFPQVKVIIITGYDNFKYAQRALKLGVIDLILKPIEQEELKAAVKHAVEEIRFETEEEIQREISRVEKNQMQLVMNDSLSEIRKKFIIDIIHGFYFEDEIFEERSKYLNLTFSKHVCFTIKPDLNILAKNTAHEEKLSEFLKSAQEVLQKNSECIKDVECIGFGIDYSFTVIAVPTKIDLQSNLNVRMIEICSLISDVLKKHTHVKFTIGISSLHKGLREVKKSYSEAQFALDCKFFIENKVIIHAASLQNKSIVNEYPIMKKINLIYEYLRIGKDLIDGLLDELFFEIKETETKDADYVRNLLIEICTISRRILVEKNENSTDMFKGPGDLYNDISKLSSITEAFDYVRAFILNVSQQINKEQRKNYSTAVKKVIDYLNENYNKKVLLQEIADVVSLSPTHLSKLIRKETGESFVDLFNKIKINIAVKLLKESNMKLYEVANEIGIENYAYFYQLFKKVTGISPKDFSK